MLSISSALSIYELAIGWFFLRFFQSSRSSNALVGSTRAWKCLPHAIQHRDGSPRRKTYRPFFGKPGVIFSLLLSMRCIKSRKGKFPFDGTNFRFEGMVMSS